MAAQILVFHVNARITVAVKRYDRSAASNAALVPILTTPHAHCSSLGIVRISNALRKLGIDTEYDMSLYKVCGQSKASSEQCSVRSHASC